MSAHRLMDEREQHGFRHRVGTLLATAETADLAIERIRLAALDLTDGELASIRRCRVLLRHFDATVLADAAEVTLSPARLGALGRLARFAASGRLEVRGAGVGAWTPDFSVFSAPERAVTLVGAHQFGNPYPSVGPLLTVVTEDPAAARLARVRFRSLWRAGHDVLPAIRQILEQAHGMGVAVAGRSRDADPGDPVR